MVVYYRNGERWEFAQQLAHDQLIEFQQTGGDALGGVRNGNAEIAEPANWLGLENDFWNNMQTFAFILASPTQAILFQVVANGKKRESSEQALITALNALGIVYTEEQKGLINTLLQNNFF